MLIVVYILAGIYGLCVGSFLNVVIYRLPRNMNLAKPSSHCPNCNYKLRWYDNIPVLSYLILGGKCRNCKCHISFRYTAVELLNTVLWLLAAILYWEQSPLYAIAVALACSLFICIGCIDFETMFIPDILSYLLLIPAFMAIVSMQVGTWWEHLIGLAVGGGIFGLCYLVFRFLLKKDGLGTGDILLMTTTGLLLGWKATLVSVILSNLLACLVIIPYQCIKKKKKDMEFPFAPFLSFGSVAAIFTAEPLINWYINLLF